MRDQPLQGLPAVARVGPDQDVVPGHVQRHLARDNQLPRAKCRRRDPFRHQGRAQPGTGRDDRQVGLAQRQPPPPVGQRATPGGTEIARPGRLSRKGGAPVGMDEFRVRQGREAAGRDIGCGDRDDAVAEQRRHPVIGIVMRAIGDTQIDPVAGQRHRVLLDPQVKADARVEAAQAGDQPGLRHRGQAGHDQPRPHIPLAQFGADGGDVRQRGFKARIDGAARVGQGDPVALTQEQLLAVVLFQMLDLLADRRRGHPQFRPRLHEGPRTGGGLEGPQGVERQVGHIVSASFSYAPRNLIQLQLPCRGPILRPSDSAMGILTPKETVMRDLVDLERYPLDRPDSPEWAQLVTRAKADLAREGMFNLEGFLRPRAIAADVERLAPRFATDAFTHARRHNIYFRKDIPGLAPGHPALVEVETVNNTLCADQLGDTALMRLYEWPEFAAFLAAVMDKPALYAMDDPLARLNAMSYGEGQGLNWHFDRSEFTTTLLLQAPEAGSVFEYRSDLRSEEDPNYDGVAALLRGEDREMRALTLAPGTLNVFRGKHTAHRVTPAQGPRARMIAVFSYYERPGVQFSPEERVGFYGRAA